jgi:hypothetical protein
MDHRRFGAFKADKITPGASSLFPRHCEPEGRGNPSIACHRIASSQAPRNDVFGGEPALFPRHCGPEGRGNLTFTDSLSGGIPKIYIIEIFYIKAI